MGVVLGREGGTWHWVRPQEGHVLTARQRDHTSPRLDGVAAPPHSWTEWPHVLMAGRSAWLLCWEHQGTEAVEEGRGPNVLMLLVIQLWCSRDYGLGG